MSRGGLRTNVLQDILSVNYGIRNKFYLSNRAIDNQSFVQRMKLVSRLDVHNGCVNTICWSSTGQYMLSGSDDQHLVVVNPFTGKTEISFHTAHRANIFSAKFLPGSQDKQTVSCSADGFICYYDFERPDLPNANGFECHLGAVYEVLTVPNDSYTFLSCGEDGTVRWFDLRTKTRCNRANCEEDVMINTRQAVMSLAVNPMMPYQLAIGCADSTVRIYDRRQLATGAAGADLAQSRAMLHMFSAPSVGKRKHRITSLAYSQQGDEILVSYSSEHLYLFNLRELESDNHVPLLKSFKDLEEINGASVDDDCSASASPSCSTSSDAASPGEYVFRPCIGKQPPIKRLRLRGDWSDTGPNARPERERDRTPQDETAASIMQRMSNMLTSLLEGRMRQDQNPSAGPSNESSHGQESQETVEPGADELAEQDRDAQATDSSISNSDNSDLAFVSFSASEKEDSGEDSKEAYEMSEDGRGTSANKISEQSLSLPFESIPSRDLLNETTAESLETAGVAEESLFDSPNSETAAMGQVSPEAAAVSEALEPAVFDSDHQRNEAEVHENDDSQMGTAKSQKFQDVASGGVSKLGERMSSLADSFAEVDVAGCSSETDESAKKAYTGQGRKESREALAASASTASASTASASTASAVSGKSKEQVGVDLASSGPFDAPDSDHDTDSEEMRDSPANRQSLLKQRLEEKNAAASKLQAIFRQRLKTKSQGSGASLPKPALKQCYIGHRNSRTMIKEATFWGDNYVMSGSDCGHIFIWDRRSAKLAMLLEGDRHVVNCLQPHPFDPILASSGIDYDIKIWMPANDSPCFDPQKSAELMRRNEVMLEETRDTVTVPASFMLRMLLSLNHIRRGNRSGGSGREESGNRSSTDGSRDE